MHISQEELNSFQQLSDSMSTEETIAFLEHMEHCDYCLQHMLDHEKTFQAAQAPAYLKEQILTKASTPSVRADKTIHTVSYRMQLFYCGLKTAAGVLMALFLLFSVTKVDFASITPEITTQKKLPVIPSGTQKSQNYLQDFSRKINQNLNEGSDTLAGYLTEFSNKIINGGR